MNKQSLYVEDNEVEKKQKEQKNITFNGMSATEWALSSRSVWKDLPPYRENDHLKMNNLPLELVDRLIGMYTKEGDKVLDPFMGCGSSVIGAIQNNRFCYGFEIKKKVFNMAQQNIVSSLNLLVNADYEIYNDNALEGLDYIDSNDVQLVISAPSLPSLKEVEEEQVEFDKMNKEQYLTNMEIIFKKLYRIVKKGGYCTFVVDDYRDIKHKEPYVELHSEIAQIGKKVGFLYQDCIIYDHNDQRGLLLLGYPRIFYANMNHTYIVVLRKE